MPAFNFNEVRIGKYVNTAGVITYTDHTLMGDAISLDIQKKYAEGRLYAKGAVGEHIKECIGGTCSAGVKYILANAQKLLFGASDSTRTIGTSPNTTSITGLKHKQGDVCEYVGLAGFAEDQIDGQTKYSCIFLYKAQFSLPATVFKTREGATINFQSPTTVGEFEPDDSTDHNVFETATCDTEADARAWCKLLLGET